MISISDLIQISRERFLDVSVSYVFPDLYVTVVNDDYQGFDEDSRLLLYARGVGIDVQDISDLLDEAQIILILATPQEVLSRHSYLKELSAENHWLALFDPVTRDAWSKQLATRSRPVGGARALHFYGFKGGQARSTVLMMLAKYLAGLGYKVLMVDADVEAPSLSSSLNVATSALSSSLVGLVRGHSIEPIAADATGNGGSIDLIPAKPDIQGFDLDYASFVLRVNLDAGCLQRAVTRLSDEVSGAGYDFVLFDHRTGLASSVIPTIMGMPGSVVINARPDGLSENQDAIVSALLSVDQEYPGAFVCFSLDPERPQGVTGLMEARLKERMLSLMADALSRAAEGESEQDPDALTEYFVSWYHDRAFLDGGLPHLSEISSVNMSSLKQLATILGVSMTPIERRPDSRADFSDNLQSNASPSGALDTGWFLETPDVSKILQNSLSSCYVFGRKGTGKTRLFRELSQRRLARPMHSAADYAGASVQAQSALSNEMFRFVNGDFERYWWLLLGAELQSAQTDRPASEILAEWIAADERSACSAMYSASLSKSLKQRVTIAIDGVETTVDASKTHAFIESLFRFLSTIQNDQSFSEKVRFRLFIRSDLPVGIQNIEQQVHGRKVDLRWDQDSIFHYVLAEIARNKWFEEKFPEVCGDIENLRTEIEYRRLLPEQYEALLLRVFPQKLRRNNLLTMTFLRSYFSDAAGEGDHRSSFYPRVFGGFLAKVSAIAADRGEKAMDGDRVSHNVVLEAFESAAREFIDEVKQELNFALSLKDAVDENKRLVSDLLQAFSGLQTPFVLDQCVEALNGRLESGVEKSLIRKSLIRMKDMGIFEDHPVKPEMWRAGRLFKEGLRMKYVR